MELIKKRWENIKWFIKEFMKIGSVEKSFFSKKRIFEITAFTSGEVTLLSFFFVNIYKLPTLEAIAIASIFFTVAGYTLNKTEAAKKAYIEDNKDSKENNLEEPK